MEALAIAGMELVGAIVSMVREAKQASAEKSADIAARFAAARAMLTGAYDEAHATLEALRGAAKGSGA